MLKLNIGLIIEDDEINTYILLICLKCLEIQEIHKLFIDQCSKLQQYFPKHYVKLHGLLEICVLCFLTKINHDSPSKNH